MNIHDIIKEWESEQHEPWCTGKVAQDFDTLVRFAKDALTWMEHLAGPEGWDGNGRQGKARDFLERWSKE